MYMGRKCLSLLRIPTFRAIFLIKTQYVEPNSGAHQHMRPSKTNYAIDLYSLIYLP